MALLSTPSTTITTTTSHHLSKLFHPHSSLSTVTFPATKQHFTLTHFSKSKFTTNVSFFTDFLSKTKSAESIKQELLEAIDPLDRGAEASIEDQQTIEQVFISLKYNKSFVFL